MLSELREYIDACFTGLWVQTHEPEEEMIQNYAFGKAD